VEVASLIAGSLLLGASVGRAWAALLPTPFFVALYLFRDDGLTSSPDESALIVVGAAVGCGLLVLLGVLVRRLVDVFRAPEPN
jgi:hypothetical protein